MRFKILVPLLVTSLLGMSCGQKVKEDIIVSSSALKDNGTSPWNYNYNPVVKKGITLTKLENKILKDIKEDKKFYLEDVAVALIEAEKSRSSRLKTKNITEFDSEKFDYWLKSVTPKLSTLNNDLHDYKIELEKNIIQDLNIEDIPYVKKMSNVHDIKLGKLQCRSGSLSYLLSLMLSREGRVMIQKKKIMAIIESGHLQAGYTERDKETGELKIIGIELTLKGKAKETPISTLKNTKTGKIFPRRFVRAPEYIFSQVFKGKLVIDDGINTIKNFKEIKKVKKEDKNQRNWKIAKVDNETILNSPLYKKYSNKKFNIQVTSVEGLTDSIIKKWRNKTLIQNPYFEMMNTFQKELGIQNFEELESSVTKLGKKKKVDQNFDLYPFYFGYSDAPEEQDRDEVDEFKEEIDKDGKILFTKKEEEHINVDTKTEIVNIVTRELSPFAIESIHVDVLTYFHNQEWKYLLQGSSNLKEIYKSLKLKLSENNDYGQKTESIKQKMVILLEVYIERNSHRRNQKGNNAFAKEFDKFIYEKAFAYENGDQSNVVKNYYLSNLQNVPYSVLLKKLLSEFRPRGEFKSEDDLVVSKIGDILEIFEQAYFEGIELPANFKKQMDKISRSENELTYYELIFISFEYPERAIYHYMSDDYFHFYGINQLLRFVKNKAQIGKIRDHEHLHIILGQNKHPLSSFYDMNLMPFVKNSIEVYLSNVDAEKKLKTFFAELNLEEDRYIRLDYMIASYLDLIERKKISFHTDENIKQTIAQIIRTIGAGKNLNKKEFDLLVKRAMRLKAI